jgi:nucleotide-binding universal stress UspA family protein
MLPIHTILYSTDFSSLSYHAFEVAAALAADYRARLVVLHVHEPPLPLGELVPSDPAGYHETLLENLRELKPSGQVAADYRVEVGTVAEGIVRVANEINCDLIVLGTQGKSGLRRAILGSVAESVLRKSPCLVLAVKPGAVTQRLTDAARGSGQGTGG